MRRLAGVFLFAAITLSFAFAAPVPPRSQLRTNDYSWHPETSPRGPVLMVISLPEQQAYVYRNGVLIEAELHGQASASRSQPYYLDVTHPEANKGGVVEFLSKRSHIAPEEIATIGDMPNDVMMFEKSGLSIAMDNASSQVQAQANFVTLSNQKDGFACAMDKFVLPTATSASAP
ncbi:MAG TPA: HAD hydrolase family protein [Candidatus Udaeobacter sp.]|nr:HAD hydrolase family protein [Candidatus Udaeobacter sp.]